MAPMRLLPATTALLVALLAAPAMAAVPPRSDRTLVELIDGTMATLPNAVDQLAAKIPGGLHATPDAPPQIVRSVPFVTKDGYRVSALEVRGFSEGGDVPMARFTSIQLEQRPCFTRADVAGHFHMPSSETALPSAPSMLPNRYTVMQMGWGRLSFGTSKESGDCVIAIVGDATGGLAGTQLPLPLPQPTSMPGMPDLRRTWPMPADAYPAE
ncbi:hypothetical protein KPL74_08245 [Bacillus sp. NP157]|nr:hypothetical protein KPL74_08245 [Bacillus sp. NP157]